jgi:hypothetical protein
MNCRTFSISWDPDVNMEAGDEIAKKANYKAEQLCIKVYV